MDKPLDLDECPRCDGPIVNAVVTTDSFRVAQQNMKEGGVVCVSVTTHEGEPAAVVGFHRPNTSDTDDGEAGYDPAKANPDGDGGSDDSEPESGGDVEAVPEPASTPDGSDLPDPGELSGDPAIIYRIIMKESLETGSCRQSDLKQYLDDVVIHEEVAKDITQRLLDDGYVQEAEGENAVKPWPEHHPAKEGAT